LLCHHQTALLLTFFNLKKLDKAVAPKAVGAGIGMQPIGLSALKKLGLLDTVLKHGARIDGIQTKNARGDPVLDVSYSRFDPRLFGVGLHRGVLFESLLEECEKHREISQIFGVDISELDQQTNHVTLRDETGRAYGPYDMVRCAH
jgi:2-polyprenyl-6-methoxyphenol hydroxylase-like FAD-dependent oxidoreductase